MVFPTQEEETEVTYWQLDFQGHTYFFQKKQAGLILSDAADY